MVGNEQNEPSNPAIRVPNPNPNPNPNPKKMDISASE
jgi:hypothetical protein